MKVFLKTTVSIILTLIITASAAILTSFAAEKTTKKTLVQYTVKSFSDTKTSSKEYKCKVKNNSKNYIDIDFSDEGNNYRLSVTAKKKTSEKKPTVTIYYEKNGEMFTVKKYKITVNAPEKINFENVKINEKMTKSITLKNPYTKTYTFKYKKKIAKIYKSYTKKGEKYTYKVKGLKKGATTVKVYLKGTKKKIGSFNFTVGDYATKVKKNYKTLNLNYNAHGSSNYMKGCSINLDSILKHKKHKAVYSAIVDNEKVASTIIEDDTTYIYSTGKGETTAEIFQKIGKEKKKQIATIKINVTKTKMSFVCEQNMLWFDGGIFGSGDMREYLNPGDTLNLKKTIVNSLIDNIYTGSHFKKSLYSISYKSSDTSVVTVNSDGKATAKKVGLAEIKYTITFSDKSVFKGNCPIEVWQRENAA